MTICDALMTASGPRTGAMSPFAPALRPAEEAPSTAIGGAILNDKVLSLDISELSQTSAKRIKVRGIQLQGNGFQHANSPHLP